MSTDAWSGRKVTEARTNLETRTTWPTPCGKCRRTVHQHEPWVCGHIIGRAIRPDLIWEPSNHQVEHRRCSDASGQAAVIQKARAEGAALERAGFSPTQHPRQPPPLPFSPSRDAGEQIEVREGLIWPSWDQDRHPWLNEFLEVPEDASPPLWMSRPHDDAVGSYGPEAIAWIEAAEGKKLRWWQRLAVTRQLEHRADGSLCHQTILESASRRSGKSVRIRGMALWRMAVGPSLFGERQEVVHTGSDIAVCRKAQKEAWRWAIAQGWTVTKGNGKEAIETPDGDAWLVRAQDATYGWDTTLALVDESWDVRPETVDDGLEPSIMERSSSQLHLTSTAHRRARSTMRSRLMDALTRDDGETLVLVWAAPFGADIALESTWRAASPHWTESRRKMIAGKYAKALAGEVDPEADDADPMAGFEAQYLNRWRLRARRVVRGDSVVDPEEWALLATEVPFEVPAAAAIESWFEQGVSLGLGWKVEGCAVVSVTGHADLESAVAALRGSGFRGPVTVGASLVKDPAVARLRIRPGEASGAAATTELRRLLDEDLLRHDGQAHLSDQVLALRTSPGTSGPRLVSTTPRDAVNAAVWAARSARVGGRGVRIVLPSS